MIEIIFIILASILFIGFIAEKIFEKTKIPDVLFLILIGILISTIFRWISPEDFGSVTGVFTTFALIFLLFEAGININMKRFVKSIPSGMKLSVIGFVLTFFIVFLVSLVIGLGINSALLAGAILSGISSAVVIPIIQNIRMDKNAKLSLFFDSAFSDVLAILSTVTLVEILMTKQFDFFNTSSSLLASFLIAIAIGFVFGAIWIKILAKFRQTNTNSYILTLAVMMFLYSLSELLKGNGAIACLIFGIILGNSKKIYSILDKGNNVITYSGKKFYSEISFLVKTFFFVYLGILIDFSQPLSFVFGAIILVGIYAVRPFAVYVALPKKSRLKDALILETLVPKGLAAAVLIQLPIQAGIIGTDKLVNIVLSVIFLSILSSTVFIYLIQNGKFKGFYKFLQEKYIV